MTRVSVEVAASADDAWQQTAGSAAQPTFPVAPFAQNSWSGFIFRPTVPVTALVAEAALIVQAGGTSGSPTAPLRVYGEVADSPAQFAATTGNISSRARTTAFVDWNIPIATTVGTFTASPNLSAVLQEIIEGADYGEGDPFSLLVTVTGSASLFDQILMFDAGASFRPRLALIYFTGPGTVIKGTGTLSAGANVTRPGAASLSGAATLTAAGEVTRNAAVALAGRDRAVFWSP